jgi:DNA topoisomerase-6 subunit A
MYNAARFRQTNPVVRQGSMNLAFASQRMAIPKAKFMGLSSAAHER